MPKIVTGIKPNVLPEETARALAHAINTRFPELDMIPERTVFDDDIAAVVSHGLTPYLGAVTLSLNGRSNTLVVIGDSAFLQLFPERKDCALMCHTIYSQQIADWYVDVWIEQAEDFFSKGLFKNCVDRDWQQMVRSIFRGMALDYRCANRRCVGEYVDRTVELFRTLHAAQNIESEVREKWDSAYSTAGYCIKVALGVTDPNVTVYFDI